MKIGFHVGQVVFRGHDLQQQYLDHLEQFRAARDAGFAWFSWGHHWLIHPFQHLQPVPMLARFAAEAGSMELMTMLLLTPLLNPVAVAEEIATLDHICGGRFIFGAGLGYRPQECEAAGIALGERAARFEEGLHLMKRLWTEDEVTHHGRFYRVTEARPTARCFQHPYPRIWVAGMTEAAVKRAGRLGHPFIPSGLQSRGQIRTQLELWRASLAAHGHQAGPDLPILREFYVAPTRDEAMRRARSAIEAKYGVYAEHGFPGTSERLDEGIDRLVDDAFIVGDPEDCVERLSAYAELGFTHVALRLLWPGMVQRDVLRMIDLTGRAVIPRVARG
jgi:alkanesulfonate monooxygenase SsuD/methylene tetrahydromethanopterin reductase-like flavin-dependent oxidoreductase (luciferase family)